MDYDRLFRFLVIDKEVGRETVTGRLLDSISAAIKARGYNVHTAKTALEAKIAIQNDAAIACFLIDWDQDGKDFSTTEIIDFIRQRNEDVPIFLITERHRIEEFSSDVLKEVKGYIFLQEDTPEFIAKFVSRHYLDYIESIKTPFFGGMIDYVESGNQMWLAPGHNGGIFYEKSPIGRIFFEYLGENFFRADFNFVPDLGDIFGHSGPFLEAEQGAARIFGADKTYFVLNGTSTSNKMVNGATVAKDDLILFDRNNHKSHHHSALMLNGGIPIFLSDDRNSFGMVGPINYDNLDEDFIRRRIKENRLVKDPDAWKKERPFRLAIIENCTYDGTIYNVKTLLEKIGPLCDYIFLDEAWGTFMRFHPIYRGRYGMGLDNLTDKDPGLLITQSTHKQLAGISQASQIHVKDSHIKGQKRRVNHKRLNEVYMMHMSTSPFYPMFASLDVGAQMMKGRNGQFLWDDAIKTGIEIRKKIRSLAKEYTEREENPARHWFFDPFVPDVLELTGSEHTEDMQNVRWEDIPTDVIAKEQQCWLFREGASWHGYTNIKDDYVMVDPTKMLLLTPGIDRKTGEYQDWGIPGPVVAAYLRAKGIVPEKADFNSILFLITPAVEKSKAGTLLAALVEFKNLYDGNADLVDFFPDLVEEFPDFYKGKKIQELCREIHGSLKKYDARLLQKQQFQMKHFPEMAMTPQDAHNAFIANKVDYVPLDKIKGRIAATLALVYPPGIGVIMPGERYDDRAQPMINYFKMFEVTNNMFPGFENEIQGMYFEKHVDGTMKYFTYVVKE